MQEKSKHIIDYIICTAVFCQSLLVIVQLYMIDILHMNEELATQYRVLLTAVPMSIALVMSFFRRPSLFIFTYLFSALILFFSVTIHPETSEIALHEASRFTMPLVIGSALCLICVNDIKTINNTLYWISYIIAIVAVIYFLSFYALGTSAQFYSMSFSYALIFPMLILYSRKKVFPIIVSFSLFLMVLVLGSRGAAVFFILYIVIDLFVNNKKMIIPFLFISIIAFSSLSYFAQYLDTFGIESRTLTHLMASDHSGQDSGRFGIYEDMFRVLNDNSIFGIGLYGDRLYLNGSYCHNFFLEVLLNLGYFLGLITLFIFCLYVIYTYHLCDKNEKSILLLYLFSIMGPLMVSHSYLIDYNFGIFIGVICILHTMSLQKIKCKYEA